MNLATRRRAHFLAWLESEGLNAKQVADHSNIPYTTLHSYVKGAATATKSLKGDTEAQIAAAYSLPVEAIFGGAVEGEGLANHVRAWRMERGVGIDALAQKIGVAVPTLEDLEAGKMAFSPSWRRRIADALGLPEGYMLLNPEDVPLEVMEMFSPQTPPAQRQRAKEMLRLLRTGTD